MRARIRLLAGKDAPGWLLWVGTGARVVLGSVFLVAGKGRKQRRTPLIPTTKAVVKAWLTELGGDLREPLFPSTTGSHLSRDAIEHRLARHLEVARRTCPSLSAKAVTMHTLRHTAAM